MVISEGAVCGNYVGGKEIKNKGVRGKDVFSIGNGNYNQAVAGKGEGSGVAHGEREDKLLVQVSCWRDFERGQWLSNLQNIGSIAAREKKSGGFVEKTSGAGGFCWQMEGMGNEEKEKKSQ